jgi:hypothetical protein
MDAIERTRWLFGRIPKGRTRLLAILAAFTVLAVYAALPAYAVHDTGIFQLDGDASSTTQPGSPPTPAATDDWDKVCHQVVGSDCSTTSNTTGATAVDWVSEPNPSASIFTGGGSKDPQDISNWAWKDAGGLPDKDNLRHSFAVRYSVAPDTTPPTLCPAGTALTCDLLYFGSDRFDNSGDAQQGFWFFQNPIGLTNIPSGGGFKFSGVHQLGDLLIISDFSNGGTVSTISVYRWNPAVSGNLELLATSSNAKCTTAAPSDQFCGLVNSSTITMPWSFTDKSGTPANGALNGEFYEGGVNLSTLGLSGECFASVASETRSSTSTTATLKDFVLGGFGHCEAGLTTTPSAGSGGSVGIGTGSVSVSDSATLTISGAATWTGTLAFHLCGPLAAGVLCASGGTAVGSSTVTNNTSQPISSDSATITSAGRYCFRGDFTSGTNGVPDAHDSSEGECFNVTPVTPALTTTASAPVEIGNPISDTGHLSGTASQPGNPIINGPAGSPAGGSITFKAYGPNDATCANAPAFTSSAVLVSGDADYNSGNFTPTTAGTYLWVASYTGNSPNTSGPVSTSCGDANESVVVSPKTPTIVTNAVAGPLPLGSNISDTATIGNTANKPNGNPAGGTVTFTAYGPNDATCANAPAFTSAAIPVNGDGTYSSGDFKPTLAGTYLWVASYTGDPPNTSGPVSTSCGDPNESSVIIQLQPSMTTGQFFYPNDSATVTVTSGAGNLNGSVHFQLFTTSDCSGNALVDETKSVGGDTTVTVSTSNTTVKVDASGTTNLYWLVGYSSQNGGQKDITGVCGNENSILTIDNGKPLP